jgi:hypothetical protein
MPGNKQQHRQQAVVIPTAQELYDLWMSQIEPELMTATIDHVDELHAGETPEERKQRYARYAQAFQKFDRHKEQVGLALKKTCAVIAKNIDERAAKKQAKVDSDSLESIDSAIQQTV